MTYLLSLTNKPVKCRKRSNQVGINEKLLLLPMRNYPAIATIYLLMS